MEALNMTAKVALITGASRGIGRQLALDCARHGIAVVVNYVENFAAAEEVVRQICDHGGQAMVVRADHSAQVEVAEMVTGIIKKFGRIDYLINNAGVGQQVALDNATEEHFDDTLRLNLKAAFLVTQEVLPYMISQGGGRLIFMSSLASRTGGVVSAAYAASKAGCEGLMHYYATYLLRHHITANAIAPALIASDMVSGLGHPEADALPLGRLGRPEEIWPALRMILETEYLTGQTIHINAGRYMT